MNYYINGDAAKAQQIKAAFEKLGYDVKNWRFTTGVYYSLNGRIVNTSIGSNEYKLILNNPDYKELELPIESKFNVGDWVVKKNGGTFYGGNYAEQITLIDVDEDGKRIWLTSTTLVENKDIRLWKIADAKDGDVLVLNGKPFIYSHNKYGKNYCYIDDWGQLRVNFYLVLEGNCVLPATKQERNLLFSKMREVGYEWDADKKELKKIPKHYNIKNFQPFDKVLVRCDNDEEWMIEFYCKYDTLVHTSPHRDYPFMGIGDSYSQCIPFEGNEHLLGTTDMCPEEYINW